MLEQFVLAIAAKRAENSGVKLSSSGSVIWMWTWVSRLDEADCWVLVLRWLKLLC